MTTITIERELLEQALNALSAPNHCVFSEPPICVDIRAALLAPATAPAQQAGKFKPGDHVSDAAPQSQPERKPMTDAEIEKARNATFSTGNPYCPVDGKSMRKAAHAVEAFHGIKEDKP